MDEGRRFRNPKFLSTPSARRATTPYNGSMFTKSFISIHALREEGDIPRYFDKKYEEISIHALREEGDTGKRSSNHETGNFYPRPPRGGRRIWKA